MEHFRRVLVVDDEWSIRQVLQDFMEMNGWDVVTASCGEDGVDSLQRERFDVVLTDLKMGAVSGIDVLEAARQSDPHAAVVLMTGYGTVQSAIEAMKKGAFDYVMKPFKLPDMARVAQAAWEHRNLAMENAYLKGIVALYQGNRSTTHSDVSQALRVLIDQVQSMVQCDALGVWLSTAGPDDAPAHHRLSDDLAAPTSWANSLASLSIHDLPSSAVLQQTSAQSWSDSVQFTPSLQGVMTWPLLGARGQSIGALAAFSASHTYHFTQGRHELLGMIVDRAALAIENVSLHGDLEATFRQTIQGLVQILEGKDRYTRGHSERVRHYTTLIARHLQLSASHTRCLAEAALIHDIGKVCIRIEDLNKDGPLTAAEYEMFKSHTTRGRWLLEPILFLHDLIPVVYHHHERWDGRGYPVGLSGEDIPFDARIVAVADSYDAMTSNRPYRRALPHDVAMRELIAGRGVQFDPKIVDAFQEAMRIEHHNQKTRRARWREALKHAKQPSEAQGWRNDPGWQDPTMRTGDLSKYVPDS